MALPILGAPADVAYRAVARSLWLMWQVAIIGVVLFHPAMFTVKTALTG
nr:hypothetical protein [Mucilaginibacter sp. FT3.2]